MLSGFASLFGQQRSPPPPSPSATPPAHLRMPSPTLSTGSAKDGAGVLEKTSSGSGRGDTLRKALSFHRSWSRMSRSGSEGSETAAPLFERLGGEEAVTSLVSWFYEAILVSLTQRPAA